MKRIFTIILCAVFLFSSVPSFSAEKESGELQKTLSFVKERIPDTSVYNKLDSRTFSQNGKNYYSFNWYTDGEIYKSMSVTAVEGIITEFSSYSDDEEFNNPGFDRMGVSEAMKKSYGLIYKLNPSLEGKLKLEKTSEHEDFNSDRFSFTVNHIENDILVKGDTGYLTVDVNAEKIRSFNMNYTFSPEYDNPDNVISADDAKKAFTEKIGFTPSYRVYNDYKEKKVKIFPVYTLEDSTLYINAVTGEPEALDEASVYRNTAMMKEESLMDSAAGASFTEAEKAEILNFSNLYSAEKLENELRNNQYLNITKEYELKNKNIIKNNFYENEYTYSFGFVKKEDDKHYYIDLTADATTGELLSYYSFSDSYYDDKAFDKEKYEKKAEEILNSFAPVKKTEFKPDEIRDSKTPYFSFTRYVNGIKVNGDSISVGFDKSNGKLTEYRINYTKGDFPDITNILTNEEICGKLFDATDYNLMYVPQFEGDINKKVTGAKLYYSCDAASYIFDALTGNRIQYDGSLYAEKPALNEYTDISGHYAHKEIEALRRFGIGFEGALFKPDEKILQKEFVGFLSSLLGRNDVQPLSEESDFDNSYKFLESRNIIEKEEINREAPITRAFASKLIVRLLELEKCAALEHIYNCPFEDVYTDKGYITILWGLNIVKGTAEKTFSPQEELTRAQAAIFIYNTMKA